MQVSDRYKRLGDESLRMLVKHCVDEVFYKFIEEYGHIKSKHEACIYSERFLRAVFDVLPRATIDETKDLPNKTY